MRKIILPRIVLPAAAAGAYILTSVFGGAARAEEPAPAKPEPTPVIAKAEPVKPKITLDAWVEDFSVVDTADGGDDSHTQRIEVIDNGNDRFFRADHKVTESGYEKERVALRPKISIGDVFSGVVEGFGSTDNSENFSIGAGLNGTIAGLVHAGFSLEKSVLAGADRRLFQIYSGINPTKSSTVKIGYFLKDGISHVHGAGWINLDDLFFGMGGNVSEEGKGKLNACVGRFAKKKGEGMGFRLWGQTDFSGNYSGELMLMLGNTFTAYFPLIDIFDKGLNDPGVGDNIADYRAPPTYARGRNAVARITASHSSTGTVNYGGELYVRTDDMLAGLLGKQVNLVAGGRWARAQLSGQKAKDTFEALLGAQIGPVTVEYYLDFGKGMKPVHMVFVGTSVRDVYDALAGKSK